MRWLLPPTTKPSDEATLTADNAPWKQTTERLGGEQPPKRLAAAKCVWGGEQPSERLAAAKYVWGEEHPSKRLAAAEASE
jgi:hypothetical protein